MNKLEQTRREMYRLLAHLKANPTGVVLMGEFESAMEAHLEVLRQKAKRGARIAELKAWVKAAVSDNKRLRRERKAFLETQAEHLNEIQRLTSLCNNKLSRVIGRYDRHGCTISNGSVTMQRVDGNTTHICAQEFKP